MAEPLPYFYSEQDGAEVRDGLNIIVEYYNSGEFAGSGWSPVVAIASDGARRVWQIIDWVGGTGDTPPTGYVGATGIVENIAQAVDVRGPGGAAGGPGPANSLSIGTVTSGPVGATITGTAPSQTLNLVLPPGDDGSNGWTPVFAVVADGERRVYQILDWTGGTGTKPATGYIGPSGIVATVAEALDVRGAPGSGSVSTVNNVDPDGAGNVSLGTANIPGLDAALAGKVDKQAGMGLSQENYTSAEKSKLAGLESSRFKGEFISLAALILAVPSPSVGDYANVDEGMEEPVARYVWDSTDEEWVRIGEASPLTASQVKQLYEENADTNAFTDSLKSKLEALSIPDKMPQAEAETGTATTQRTIDAATLKAAILEHAPAGGGGTNGQGDRYIGTNSTPPAGTYNDGDIYYQVGS